jgi:DNA-binding GntR family transcriptional regulator
MSGAERRAVCGNNEISSGNKRDSMLTNPTSFPTTLPVYVKEEIRRRIITGYYPPGYPLREQELEADLNSSRGPIREGLRLLLLSGLVEHAPRRGFRVFAYSEKDLIDLYHLRSMLEGAAVEALAHVDTKELLATLRSSHEKMLEHFEAGDVAAYFDENLRFHKSISEYAQNKPLKNVLHYVDEVSLPARYRLLSRDFSSARSVDYHESLIRMISEGDFEGARKLTEDHILSNLSQLKELYRNPVLSAEEQ